MATPDVHRVGRQDWVLANPWFWMSTGLAAGGLAWVAAALEDPLPPVRFFLIILALFGAGMSVTIRLKSVRPAFVEDLSTGNRGLVLLGLFLVYSLLAASLTILLAAAILQGDVPLGRFVLRPGNLTLIWLVTVPMSSIAAVRTYHRLKTGGAVTDGEEGSALLTLAALTAFCCCMALNLGISESYTQTGEDWDTIRLFLAVVAFVALVASPLLVVSQRVRRAVISLMVLLHFGGICTAVMAAPPAPWLLGQIWTRIYRPYLEFMYLNNAYHFYSPEPGPASYLWFRVFYEDEKKHLHGHWLKIPDIDERGRQRYPVALAYQRRLSMTEAAVAAEPALFWKVGKNNQVMPEDFFFNRMRCTPDYQDDKEQAEIIGIEGPKPLPKERLRIPFHPVVPQQQQYMRPASGARHVLQSYAVFAASRPHPDNPEWRAKSVKVYRVLHEIIPLPAFVNEMDPRDPEFYRPYYLGEYSPEGEFLKSNQDDPFLYWLLPKVRVQRQMPFSQIQSWVRKHAGDPEWHYLPDSRMWTNPDEPTKRRDP
jgi:hypothetical protein